MMFNKKLIEGDNIIIFITKYISVWGWYLISINFLTGLLILYSLERTNRNIIFIVVLFFLFAYSQIISKLRKKDLLK